MNPEDKEELLKPFKRKDCRLEGKKFTKEFCRSLGIAEPEGGIFHYYECGPIAAAVRKLSAHDRRKWAEKWFPGIVEEVLATIEAMPTRPYQVSYDRKAYRAPTNPILSDARLGRILKEMASACLRFAQPIEWWAAWNGVAMNSFTNPFQHVFATAIEQGNGEVRDILIEACHGRHPTAVGDRCAYGALLTARDPAGWEAVERLLLAAKREEGLRQTIFETVDEANLEVFVRFLRLILEHNLLRFSSALRATAVWLGHGESWPEGTRADRVLGRALEFIQHEEAPDPTRPEDVSLWLWSQALRDVHVAMAMAEPYLESGDATVRLATLRRIVDFRIPESLPILTRALDDPDERVASMAAYGLALADKQSLRELSLLPSLLQLANRLPRVKPDADVLPQSEIYDLAVTAATDRELPSLYQHLDRMTPHGRGVFGSRIAAVASPETARRMLLPLVGDPNADVRQMALAEIRRQKLKPEEASEVEAHLRKKNPDLRSSLIKLLQTQPEAQLRESVARLRDSRDRLMQEAADELEASLAPASVESAYNLYGLVKVENLTYGEEPKDRRVEIQSKWTERILKELDDAVHERRDVEVPSRDFNYYIEVLKPAPLSAARHIEELKDFRTYAEDRPHLPLIEAWEAVQDRLFGECQGMKPLDWFFALHEFDLDERRTDKKYGWDTPEHKRGYRFRLRYRRVVRQVIAYLAKRVACAEVAPPILDAFETDMHRKLAHRYRYDTSWRGGEFSWRTEEFDVTLRWLNECGQHLGNLWPKAEVGRAYRLLRFVDEPYGRNGREATMEFLHAQVFNSPRFQVLVSRDIPARRPMDERWAVAAFEAGVLSADDVLDWHYMDLCDSYRFRKDRGGPTGWLELRKKVVQFVASREAERGELPTPTTYPARRIGKHVQLPEVIKILKRNVSLSSRRYADSESRPSVFWTLLVASSPPSDLTPQEAGARLREAGIHTDRLLELAFIQPAWAEAIEHALEWPGLYQGVLWLQAHTKDDKWGVSEEDKAVWQALVRQFSPVDHESLQLGAVDVGWYRNVRSVLAPERWEKLLKFAKFACTGNGHTRAVLWANAMDGKVTTEELRRFEETRNGDQVRAFGLVPLPAGGEHDEVRRRYAVLQEYLRTSKQFGGMRQTSDKLAVGIAMENLARAAGYSDPLRLQWAMEAEAGEDLKGDGLIATAGDVAVRLYFDPLGDPQIEAKKGGKLLKELPGAAKKDPEIKALIERRKDLVRQASRTRRSLEEAMQGGTEFLPEELESLIAHPGLAPMLRQVLFLAPNGEAGFLREDGKALFGLDGRLALDGPVRIAHPIDLASSGVLADWQRAIFDDERVQPFKQAFREMYVLTAIERAQPSECTRYAGHQVQPRQALAILGKRGWIVRPEEGVFKPLYAERLVAELEFDETFFTPADIEGLTLRSLRFMRSGSREDVSLTEVPPRVFSETMRDLDLIVSVAASTGVDPEASESSIQVRTAVLRETSRLLRLENVRILDRHVVVEGQYGEYTVNLSSAEVHHRTRGHMPIVAVRQPQRGRLFLPFVDDDPRTAELVSKVILLARDQEIRDPNILAMIRG